MTRCSAQLLASSVLATLAGRAAGYWESGDTSQQDPYTQAMLMSRRAAKDPSALKQDPDLFKKMFGQLAIEQNQAKLMDEHQSTATAADRCMVCHGVILEIEKMFEERKHEATGGLGRRDQLAVRSVLDARSTAAYPVFPMTLIVRRGVTRLATFVATSATNFMATRAMTRRKLDLKPKRPT